MQLSDYNETDGILVGPEFSRLFAEIVLQDVDKEIIEPLRAKGLRFGSDYDIRRYVDGYFLFTKATDAMDTAEAEVRRRLFCYKLYINEKKVESATRPFVSPLSIARQDVAALLREASSALYLVSTATDARDARRHYSRLKSLIAEIRLVVSKYGISFANISGWVMSRLKRLLRLALRALAKDPIEEARLLLADVATTVLEQAFFLCAIDLRVRSTYSIAQICLIIKGSSTLFSDEQQDLLVHIVMDSCSAILRSLRHRQADDFEKSDSVEAFSILIVGAMFVGT